jgi:predicted Zn-dependent protease with MMP-like domain
MDDSEFEKLVGEALDSLPKEFAEKLSNVGVTFENWPNPYQIAKLRLSRRSLLFGLYEGVPLTKRGNYTGVLPDKITIFKYPILMVSRNADEVRERVRRTVIHEIGHHFGLSDSELRH